MLHTAYTFYSQFEAGIFNLYSEDPIAKELATGYWDLQAG